MDDQWQRFEKHFPRAIIGDPIFPKPTLDKLDEYLSRIEALEAESARLREALQELRGRYRLYAGWPELTWAGETDKLILARADEALKPRAALKQEGGE